MSEGSTIVADFDFVTRYGAALEGTVHVDGIPAKSARLRAWAVLPNGDEAGFYSSLEEDGSYRIDMVPTGTVNLDILWIRTRTGEYLNPEGVVVETRNGAITRRDIDIVTK